MRIVFSLFLSLTINSVYTQDTIFLNANYSKVPKDSDYQYIKAILPFGTDTIERLYTKSGKIKSENSFSNYSKHKYNGISKEWHGNGVLKSMIDYKDGYIEGIIKTYWPNGKLKREDQFIKGKFISGSCFDSTGSEVHHFDYQANPEFPGGANELFKFISENTKYSKDALLKGIEGTIYIRFVVSKSGDIDQVKVMRSVDPLLEAEALRVVKSMPKWNPGFIDGEFVNIWYILPVKFSMQ